GRALPPPLLARDGPAVHSHPMRRGLLVAALLAGVFAAVAAAQLAGDPGVTSSSILIGGTSPISGEASAGAAVAAGADAYFKFVNATAPVFKRKITYKILD